METLQMSVLNPIITMELPSWKWQEQMQMYLEMLLKEVNCYLIMNQ